MKKSKAYWRFGLWIAITLLFTFTFNTAFAAELMNLTIDMNSQTKRVTISGKHSNGNGQLVTLSVALKDNPHLLIDQQEMVTDPNGNFHFTLNMDGTSDVTGYYTAKVGGNNITQSDSTNLTYLFVNDSEDIHICNLINEATSVQDSEKPGIKSIMQDKAFLMRIDLGPGSQFDSVVNKDAVYSALIGRNFAATIELKKAFNQAIGIQKLNEGNSTTANQIITDFAEAWDIDIGANSYFSYLKEAGKSFVYAAITGKNLSLKNNGSFAALFNSKAALACINDIDTSNRDKLESVIDKLKADGYIVLDKTKYNTLSENDKVTVNIWILESQPYNTFGDFEAAFNQSVARKTTAATDEGSGGGGGRGGGSRASASISLDIPQPVTPVPMPGMFDDIENVDWAKSSILELAARGIVSGQGNGVFEPNRNVKREEFVKMLVLAFGFAGDQADISFSDVNANDWYYPYIAAAKKNMLVNGMTETQFGVGETITRQQMVAMVYRAIAQTNTKMVNQREGMTFSDSDTIADYAEESVATLYKAGIINGDAGMFKPEEFCTRAMAAKVIYGVMQAAGNIK